MKKSTYFYLLVVLVLASMALSACAGALDAQGLNFNDLTGSQTLSTESVHSTEPPEIHTTGTPEVKDQGTGEPTEVPETQVVETDVPETEQPHGSKMPEANGTPGSDNSHEVLGTVTAVDTNGITINGVTYSLTTDSEIHGTINVGDTVRLTFGDSNGTLIIHEVNVTDMNGSNDGQGGNNGQSHEGGVHENGTPESKPGDSGGSGGGSGDGGGG